MIRRLRTEEPRVDVAANAARWYGILCLGAVAWNAFLLYVMPFEEFLRLTEIDFASGR